ncbi:hypothetical protein V6N13_133490 [Hibiscus sabdariffa]
MASRCSLLLAISDEYECVTDTTEMSRLLECRGLLCFDYFQYLINAPIKKSHLLRECDDGDSRLWIFILLYAFKAAKNEQPFVNAFQYFYNVSPMSESKVKCFVMIINCSGFTPIMSNVSSNAHLNQKKYIKLKRNFGHFPLPLKWSKQIKARKSHGCCYGGIDIVVANNSNLPLTIVTIIPNSEPPANIASIRKSADISHPSSVRWPNNCFASR